MIIQKIATWITNIDVQETAAYATFFGVAIGIIFGIHAIKSGIKTKKIIRQGVKEIK